MASGRAAVSAMLLLRTAGASRQLQQPQADGGELGPGQRLHLDIAARMAECCQYTALTASRI